MNSCKKKFFIVIIVLKWFIIFYSKYKVLVCDASGILGYIFFG